jgi:hypothetical protein
MAIQKIFKATILSCRYFTRAGLAVNFMNGRFTTDNKEVEDELMEEVGQVGRTKSRHPFIFVDENEAELDTEALSPLELIKLQAKEEARQELLAEIKAQQARALDAGSNVSSTSANFAESLNTTAKQEADAASMEPKAPEGETAGATLIPAAGNTSMADKLASLRANQGK